MPDQTLVNMTFKVNNSKIRREKRGGREVIIIPSATLPDNIIMNEILYPAAEIEAGYESINNAPAPYGHPVADGKYISAQSPMGINIGWIGAHNENARREGGRVLVDKVIDVEVAESTPRGKRVLEAIENEKPIHTSTGILCNLHDTLDTNANKKARDIHIDHDAILLFEKGAATPDQGVGLFVNRDGTEVAAINSFSDDVEREMDWVAESLLRALRKKDEIPLLERIKSALMGLVPDSQNNSETEGEAEMADQDLSKLSARLDNMEESVSKAIEGIGDTVANALEKAMKPVADTLANIQESSKKAEEAEKTNLVNKLIKVNVFTKEEEADGIPLANLKTMVENHCKDGKAAALNAATGKSEDDDDEFKDVDLNADRKE